MAIFLDVTARLADEFVQCVFPDEKDELEVSATRFGLSYVRVDEHDCHVHFKGTFEGVTKMYMWLQIKQKINSRRQIQLSTHQLNDTGNSVNIKSYDEVNRNNDLGDKSVVFDKDGTRLTTINCQPRKSNDECNAHKAGDKSDCVVCEICGFIAKSTAGYTLHSKKHKVNPTVSLPTEDAALLTKCEKCGNELEEGHTCQQTSEYEVEEHILYHDDIGELNTQAISSLSSEPNENGVFPCIHDGCDFSAVTLLRTQEHYCRAHAKKAWECKICEKMSLFKRDLQKHIMETHLKELENRFGSETYFQNADGLLQCTVCNHTELTKLAMLMHCDRKHTQEHNFQCGICNRDFATEQDAIACMHCDQNQTDRLAKVCDVCGKSYKDSKWYAIHRKAHEMGTTPVQITGKKRALPGCVCEYCGKRFDTRPKFQDHMEMEHLKTRDMYRCPVCQKKFSNKRMWKEHSMRHLNIHPYHCSVCSKGFSTNSCLKLHEVIHEEKKHECPTCKKMFYTRSKVNEHMKFHETKKDFVCHICDKPCTLKSQLKAHLRLHFDETPFVCLICNMKFKSHFSCKTHIIRSHKVNEQDILMIQKSMTNYKLKYNESKHGSIKKQWIKSRGMGRSLKTVPLPPDELSSGIAQEMRSGDLDETTDHTVALVEEEKICPIIIDQSKNNVVEIASEETIIDSATCSSEILADLCGGGDVYVLTDDQTSFVSDGGVVLEKPSLHQVRIESVENE